jgi:hypothetical protein
MLAPRANNNVLPHVQILPVVDAVFERLESVLAGDGFVFIASRTPVSSDPDVSAVASGEALPLPHSVSGVTAVPVVLSTTGVTVSTHPSASS